MILLEATLLCRRPEVAHGKPRAEHVSPTFPFQAGPSSGKPRASNLLALSSVFLDRRSHVHTWSCAGTQPHASTCSKLHTHHTCFWTEAREGVDVHFSDDADVEVDVHVRTDVDVDLDVDVLASANVHSACRC